MQNYSLLKVKPFILNTQRDRPKQGAQNHPMISRRSDNSNPSMSPRSHHFLGQKFTQTQTSFKPLSFSGGSISSNMHRPIPYPHGRHRQDSQFFLAKLEEQHRDFVAEREQHMRRQQLHGQAMKIHDLIATGQSTLGANSLSTPHLRQQSLDREVDGLKKQGQPHINLDIIDTLRGSKEVELTKVKNIETLKDTIRNSPVSVRVPSKQVIRVNSSDKEEMAGHSENVSFGQSIKSQSNVDKQNANPFSFGQSRMKNSQTSGKMFKNLMLPRIGDEQNGRGTQRLLIPQNIPRHSSGDSTGMVQKPADLAHRKESTNEELTNNLSSHDFYEQSRTKSSELHAKEQGTSYSDKHQFEDSSLLYFKIGKQEMETIEKKLEMSQYSVAKREMPGNAEPTGTVEKSDHNTAEFNNRRGLESGRALSDQALENSHIPLSILGMFQKEKTALDPVKKIDKIAGIDRSPTTGQRIYNELLKQSEQQAGNQSDKFMKYIRQPQLGDTMLRSASESLLLKSSKHYLNYYVLNSARAQAMDKDPVSKRQIFKGVKMSDYPEKLEKTRGQPRPLPKTKAINRPSTEEATSRNIFVSRSARLEPLSKGQTRPISTARGGAPESRVSFRPKTDANSKSARTLTDSRKDTSALQSMPVSAQGFRPKLNSVNTSNKRISTSQQQRHSQITGYNQTNWQQLNEKLKQSEQTASVFEQLFGARLMSGDAQQTPRSNIPVKQLSKLNTGPGDVLIEIKKKNPALHVQISNMMNNTRQSQSDETLHIQGALGQSSAQDSDKSQINPAKSVQSRFLNKQEVSVKSKLNFIVNSYQNKDQINRSSQYSEQESYGLQNLKIPPLRLPDGSQISLWQQTAISQDQQNEAPSSSPGNRSQGQLSKQFAMNEIETNLMNSQIEKQIDVVRLYKPEFTVSTIPKVMAQRNYGKQKHAPKQSSRAPPIRHAQLHNQVQIPFAPLKQELYQMTQQHPLVKQEEIPARQLQVAPRTVKNGTPNAEPLITLSMSRNVDIFGKRTNSELLDSFEQHGYNIPAKLQPDGGDQKTSQSPQGANRSPQIFSETADNNTVYQQDNSRTHLELQVQQQTTLGRKEYSTAGSRNRGVQRVREVVNPKYLIKVLQQQRVAQDQHIVSQEVDLAAQTNDPTVTQTQSDERTTGTRPKDVATTASASQQQVHLESLLESRAASSRQNQRQRRPSRGMFIWIQNQMPRSKTEDMPRIPKSARHHPMDIRNILTDLVDGAEENDLERRILVEKAELMLKRNPGDFFKSFVDYAQEYGHRDRERSEMTKEARLYGPPRRRQSLLAMEGEGMGTAYSYPRFNRSQMDSGYEEAGTARYSRLQELVGIQTLVSYREPRKYSTKSPNKRLRGTSYSDMYGFSSPNMVNQALRKWFGFKRLSAQERKHNQLPGRLKESSRKYILKQKIDREMVDLNDWRYSDFQMQRLKHARTMSQTERMHERRMMLIQSYQNAQRKKSKRQVLEEFKQRMESLVISEENSEEVQPSLQSPDGRVQQEIPQPPTFQRTKRDSKETTLPEKQSGYNEVQSRFISVSHDVYQEEKVPQGQAVKSIEITPILKSIDITPYYKSNTDDDTERKLRELQRFIDGLNTQMRQSEQTDDRQFQSSNKDLVFKKQVSFDGPKSVNNIFMKLPAPIINRVKSSPGLMRFKGLKVVKSSSKITLTANKTMSRPASSGKSYHFKVKIPSNRKQTEVAAQSKPPNSQEQSAMVRKVRADSSTKRHNSDFIGDQAPPLLVPDNYNIVSPIVGREISIGGMNEKADINSMRRQRSEASNNQIRNKEAVAVSISQNNVKIDAPPTVVHETEESNLQHTPGTIERPNSTFNQSSSKRTASRKASSFHFQQSTIKRRPPAIIPTTQAANDANLSSDRLKMRQQPTSAAIQPHPFDEEHTYIQSLLQKQNDAMRALKQKLSEQHSRQRSFAEARGEDDQGRRLQSGTGRGEPPTSSEFKDYEEQDAFENLQMMQYMFKSKNVNDEGGSQQQKSRMTFQLPEQSKGEMEATRKQFGSDGLRNEWPAPYLQAIASTASLESKGQGDIASVSDRRRGRTADLGSRMQKKPVLYKIQQMNPRIRHEERNRDLRDEDDGSELAMTGRLAQPSPVLVNAALNSNFASKKPSHHTSFPMRQLAKKRARRISNEQLKMEEEISRNYLNIKKMGLTHGISHEKLVLPKRMPELKPAQTDLAPSTERLPPPALKQKEPTALENSDDRPPKDKPIPQPRVILKNVPSTWTKKQ